MIIEKEDENEKEEHKKKKIDENLRELYEKFKKSCESENWVLKKMFITHLRYTKQNYDNIDKNLINSKTIKLL